jgi:hypothetical protein
VQDTAGDGFAGFGHESSLGIATRDAGLKPRRYRGRNAKTK